MDIRLTADRPERLDKYIAGHAEGVTRSQVARWIDNDFIFVNGRIAKRSLILEPGDVIVGEVELERAAHDLTPFAYDLDVRYEDSDLIVVNKPRGMATHPSPTSKDPSLVNVLLSRGGPLSHEGPAFRPGIVHRLDKETTGLLVVAKTNRAHVALARQFAERKAGRTYLAVVEGRSLTHKFRFEAPVGRDPRNRKKMAVVDGGKMAITHGEVLASESKGQLLRLKLETGRTHQIRVHLSASGRPVVGDTLYGGGRTTNGIKVPLQLHAGSVSFEHPTLGGSVVVDCETPEDFLWPGFLPDHADNSDRTV